MFDPVLVSCSRDERRWIEKQNRAARAQRKKEEMNRIRTLVDNAYSCDPRIKKFKEEERAKKEAEKKAKAEARRKEQEAKEKVGDTASPPPEVE